jgi:hypothetical protein
MSSVTTQTLIKKMTEGAVTFKFKKVDGSVREATGTLNTDLMPAGSAKIEIGENDAAIPFYDLVNEGFRSFRRDSVIA